MSRYLFILGRNPELSMAEIFSYLEKEEISYDITGESENMILIESPELNTKKAINSLGGAIAIGKVLVSGSKEEIIRYIKKNPIYYGSSNKFSYSVIDFEENIEIRDAIKQNFKQESLKVNLKNPELAPEKLKSLINYFIFQDNFGIIGEVYDTEEAEKKDMNKPVRRNQLAISPRLARILVNLAQVKENETLVDPFCGIGVLLQEALLQGINVIGIDINRHAIEGANRNLEWLKKNYKFKANWKTLNQDSGRASLQRVDGIACEPNLGILLKKAPRKDEAIEMQKKFQDMISFILNNLKKYLKQEGKIAFTAPLIQAGGNRISCNVSKILEKTGLKLSQIENIGFPITEEKKGQIVSREIYVLEK